MVPADAGSRLVVAGAFGVGGVANGGCTTGSGIRLEECWKLTPASCILEYHSGSSDTCGAPGYTAVYNKANEMASRSGDGSYAGYLATGEQAKEGTFNYTFDAWGRLVQERWDTIELSSYAHDGLHRRAHWTGGSQSGRAKAIVVVACLCCVVAMAAAAWLWRGAIFEQWCILSLRSSTHATRVTAARRLQSMGSRRAAAPLLDGLMLDGADVPWPLTNEAQQWIPEGVFLSGPIRTAILQLEDSTWRHLVETFATSSDGLTRYACVHTLVSMTRAVRTRPDVIHIFELAVDDPEPVVCAWGARGLSDLIEDGILLRCGSRVRRALLRRMTADPEGASFLLSAMGCCDDEGRVVLESLLQDPDPEVRAGAEQYVAWRDAFGDAGPPWDDPRYWAIGLARRLKSYPVPTEPLFLFLDLEGLHEWEAEQVGALVAERLLPRCRVRGCLRLLGGVLCQSGGRPDGLGSPDPTGAAGLSHFVRGARTEGTEVDLARPLRVISPERLLYVGDGQAGSPGGSSADDYLGKFWEQCSGSGRVCDAVPLGRYLTGSGDRFVTRLVEASGGVCHGCDSLGMSASADATGEPADLVTPDARLSARLREYRPDHADGMVIWLDLRGLSDEACATTIDIVREGLSDALGSAVKGWVLSRNGLALFPPNGRPLAADAHPAGAWRALECSAPRAVRPSDLHSGLSAALRLANQISEPAARKRVLYIGAAALPVPGGAALVDSMNYQRLPVDVVAITTKILPESAALLREWSASSGGICIGCGHP